MNEHPLPAADASMMSRACLLDWTLAHDLQQSHDPFRGRAIFPVPQTASEGLAWLKVNVPDWASVIDASC